MSRTREPGGMIAEVLASSWRRAPQPCQLSAADLQTVAPLLLNTGAAGLAYRRLKSRPALSRPFQAVHRLHALHRAVQEQQLADLFARFGAVGIEPLLVKGWSVARLYPDPGLRPAGDIDLCVHPADLDAAQDVLTRAGGKCGSVDLHAGVADLDRSLEAILARSRVVPLARTTIRILGAEDQLRHLCLHLMRHGGWRPLWLCDVAVALESLPAGFDWDYCLWGGGWQSDWVRCTLGLARRLLGAEGPAEAVPRWVAHCLLAAWSQGADSNDTVSRSFRQSLSRWAEFRQAIRQRWPNPIRAAFRLQRGPYSRCPRPVLQMLSFLIRAGQFTRSRPLASQLPFALHPAGTR